LPGLTPQVGYTRLVALNWCGTRASPSFDAIHDATSQGELA
jgi:hypothetical protein